MQLVDALSPRDKETIKHYIQLYAGVAEPAPMEILLKSWNKNKRTMYKALGNQLRVKIPVVIPRNDSYYKQELEGLYHPIPIWDQCDAEWFQRNLTARQAEIKDPFVFEYLNFISRQDWYNDDLYYASRLLLHQNLETGYVNSVIPGRMGENENGEYHFQAFKATIKEGMKTIRTIQKVLKAMHFPYMDMFETWRNKVNNLSLNQDIKANLVISIHPLDFMTMSDNACNWTSCMSWIGNGSYSAGTIEMMNSNMTVLAYLESPSPFKITFDEQDYQIPNKSWRTLLYVHKDILLGGKPYPYFNKELTIKCLDIMRGLVEKNLHWNYKYINQPYRDNQRLHSNFYLKRQSIDSFDRPKNVNKKKHAIYIYTNCMYNDTIEYKDDFICCRNYVPKTIKLCASGPATCMCCGNPMEDPSYIDSYDDIGSEKICYECRQEHSCHVCGNVQYYPMKYHWIEGRYYKECYVCSDACLNELIYVPSQNQYIKKALAFQGERYFVFGKEKGFKESNEVSNFISRYSSFWNCRELAKEDLQSSEFFAKHATIIRVPSWVFSGEDYVFSYTSGRGWYRRPIVSGVIKFFDADEKLENLVDVMTQVERDMVYLPAKEVINNEVSRTISFAGKS